MKQTAIIFGASLAGRRTHEYYCQHYLIAGFADNDTKKHNTQLLGLPIHAPATLPRLNFDVILIGSTYSGDITRQLVAMGIPSSRIGWVNHDILQGAYEGVRFYRLGLRVGAALLVVGLIAALVTLVR